MRVVIIGGGPAGLAALKYLTTAPKYFPDVPEMQVDLYEEDDDVGGVFKARVWRGVEMVSSKYLTAFSDFRLPEDAPDFLPVNEYLAYLKAYVKHFGLEKHIHLNTKVTSVRPFLSENGTRRHEVTTRHVRKKAFDPASLMAKVQLDESMLPSVSHCHAVVVSSGLHVTPCIPTIPGLVEPATKVDQDGQTEGEDRSFTTNPAIRVMHSSTFKNKPGAESEYFTAAKPGGSTVVVLGAGETGHDIAYTAVTSPHVRRVVLASRDGFFVAPKIIPAPVILRIWGVPTPGTRPNKPIDTAIASLFDTAYVPPLLQHSQLQWKVYEYTIKAIFAWICGTSWGLDQWAGEVSSGRRHLDSLFFVKTQRAIPYISAPFRGGTHAFARAMDAVRAFFINTPQIDTQGRVIEVAGWPSKVGTEVIDGAVLDNVMSFPVDGSKESKKLQENNGRLGPVVPDLVILATGYDTSFAFLDKKYPTLSETTQRGIWKDDELDFAYIGFVRPSVGAIPPLAELQVLLWATKFLQALSPAPSTTTPPRGILAPYELDYALHPRGAYDFFHWKGGVEQESYAYQLALDAGAAPTAGTVLRAFGWRVFFTWAMGPNFTTKFRLVGPWADPELAVPIMRGELYRVVKRTGGGVFFFTFTIVPLVLFGTMSLAIMAVTGLWEGIKSLGRGIANACKGLKGYFGRKKKNM